MKFNDVVLALEEGKMAARSSWESGTFIFQQVPAVINKDIIPKMQSLPQSVKDEFERRGANNIFYANQIAICNAGNLIQGYAALPHDILALDWVVISVGKQSENIHIRGNGNIVGDNNTVK